MFWHIVRKSTTSQHWRAIWDIPAKLIGRTVNFGKFLLVKIARTIKNTEAKTCEQHIKTNENNTKEPFTPLEVRLSLSDQFSWRELKQILGPVKQNFQFTSPRCLQRPGNWRISLTICYMIYWTKCFETLISNTDV